MNKKQYRLLYRELRIHNAVWESLVDANKRQLANLLSTRFWDDALRAGTADNLFLISHALMGERDEVGSYKLRRALREWRFKAVMNKPTRVTSFSQAVAS
jgi:hypothetical protein